jgi:hypothetical protein
MNVFLCSARRGHANARDGSEGTPASVSNRYLTSRPLPTPDIASATNAGLQPDGVAKASFGRAITDSEGFQPDGVACHV